MTAASKNEQPPSVDSSMSAWLRDQEKPRLFDVFTKPPKPEKYENPRWDWTRRRANRRRIVIGLVTLYLATGLIFGFVHLTGFQFYFLFSLAVAVAAMSYTLLSQATRGLMDLDPEYLDERQMLVRLRAQASIYNFKVTTLIAYLLLFSPLVDLLEGHTAPNARLACFMTVIYVATALPAMVVAWTQADDPVDASD